MIFLTACIYQSNQLKFFKFIYLIAEMIDFTSCNFGAHWTKMTIFSDVLKLGFCNLQVKPIALKRRRL